jgi:hypothetical protein
MVRQNAGCAESLRRSGSMGLRSAKSGIPALLLVGRKNERLDEAQDKPDCQKRKAFERETLKLEKKLGDHKRDHERDRLLLESDLNAKIFDERKHRTHPHFHNIRLNAIQLPIRDKFKSEHTRRSKNVGDATMILIGFRHGLQASELCRLGNGERRVEYFDIDGGCCVTIFAGPEAERGRATILQRSERSG